MSVPVAWLRRIHRINVRAPELALLILMAVSLLGFVSAGTRFRAAADDAIARAEAGLLEFPYRFGPWIGSDTDLVSGTTDILHTTAILSRRYVNLASGESLSLAIVYCGDVRDMLGHNPSVCYPQSGWIPGPSSGERVVLDTDLASSARVYRFTTTTPAGEERRITIVGFYLLPGGGSTDDSDSLRDMSIRRSVSSRGIGQVQVLLEGWPETEGATELASQFLSTMPRQALGSMEVGRVEGSMTEDSMRAADGAASATGGKP